MYVCHSGGRIAALGSSRCEYLLCSVKCELIPNSDSRDFSRNPKTIFHMGYGVLATVLRTSCGRASPSLLLMAPLSGGPPAALAASATGGVDPPPCSGPAPTPAPAPLVPFALPECTRCNLNFAIRVIFGHQYEADLGEG